MPLSDVVRKACLPAIWSQGVKLAREGSVQRVSGTASEVVLRVRAPGLAVAPTVTLYLDDEEWSCDCGGKVDPCAHVAAAAIGATQESAGGPALEQAAAEVPPRLVYRFVKHDRRLGLARLFVFPDGREERLTTSLGELLARGKLPTGLTPTHDDVKVDRILGVPPRPVVPLDRLRDVFDALSTRVDVTFDGKPITLSGEGLAPRGSVSDGPQGAFVLRVEKDPESSVAAMGVGRVGDVLRPLAETSTTGEFLEKLPLVRSFGKSEQAELVTRVIPELEKKITVDVQTKRLPRKAVAARPRLLMDLSSEGHTLSIMPLLVYGDPPIARIDGAEMVPIGRTRGVPVRRMDEERTLVGKLRDALNLVPGRRVHFDGDLAVRFAAKLRTFQESLGETGFAEVHEDKKLVPRLVTEGDRFDVVFELDTGDGDEEMRRADARQVIRAWRGGLDLVPLDGGGWAPLPAGWLAEHGDRVADLLAARDEEGRVPKAALPELGALCESLDLPKPLGLADLAPLVHGFEGIKRAELPADLRAELRPYQREGVDWLSFLRDAELGAVLADDMGLGKTLQTIATLRGRVLVVCPKSVVYNWEAEIARFRPSLRTSIYHGTSRAIDPKADVTLTTYAVLRLDLGVLRDEDWDIVVLDEAQAIKNPESQTARAAFELGARFRVALSGTPVENRLEELWSVLRFANPGLLGGLSGFRERYSEPISRGENGAADRLRAKVRPFVLRRMKKEVLPDLPPRTEAVLHVELEPEERVVYDAVRAATRKEVAEKLAQGGSVLAALEALLRLRQAACHPSLVPGQRAAGSSKIERLLEALEEAAADGHKALVFSQWTSLLDLVEPHLKEAGVRFTRLDGSTKDRQSVVATFQDAGGPPVMLVSLKAGGTGLNLTAADHVFLLDPWWNPAVEDQAADRAHRIGQDRPVMVYRLVAKDTVEERILLLQEKKRAVADVALGGANAGAGLTREDLLALLA